MTYKEKLNYSLNNIVEGTCTIKHELDFKKFYSFKFEDFREWFDLHKPNYDSSSSSGTKLELIFDHETAEAVICTKVVTGIDDTGKNTYSWQEVKRIKNKDIVVYLPHHVVVQLCKLTNKRITNIKSIDYFIVLSQKDFVDITDYNIEFSDRCKFVEPAKNKE